MTEFLLEFCTRNEFIRKKFIRLTGILDRRIEFTSKLWLYFFSANIHQGDELFSFSSRGKQCAFMSLSALLTVQNIPLATWCKIAIDDVLLQGDQMYLNTFDSGFMVLDPCVEYLSVFVDRNMFSY